MKFGKLTKITATVLACAAVFTACSQGGENPSQGGESAQGESSGYTLKIAYNGSLCEAPVQMADTLGFFEQEGLSY